MRNHPCIPGIKPTIMDDVFDVLLDSVCENFIEYFSINVHKGTDLKFSFFVESCGLGTRMTEAS